MNQRTSLRARAWGSWLFTALLAGSGCTASLKGEVKATAEAEPASETEGAKEPAKTEPEIADAPTELIDDSPPATVTIIYRRSQITACAMAEEDGEKVCTAKTQQPHRGKAEVVLTPTDDQGEDDSSRVEQVLTFEDGPAEQTKVVELKKGRWTLEWKGEATARERFKVVPKDRFDVSLDGVAGLCELDGTACKLQPQKTQQVIELPEARVTHD
jgi:hypothetical protein